MENPCKNCDRKGCGSYHDECKEYNEWKAEQDERKAKIREWNKYDERDYIKLGAWNRRTHGMFRGHRK